MNIAEAYKYAERYGMLPKEYPSHRLFRKAVKKGEAFPSLDAFVRAVEQRFDQEMLVIVQATGCEEASRRQVLIDANFGHDWDRSRLRCWDCGKSFRDFVADKHLLPYYHPRLLCPNPLNPILGV